MVQRGGDGMNHTELRGAKTGYHWETPAEKHET